MIYGYVNADGYLQQVVETSQEQPLMLAGGLSRVVLNDLGMLNNRSDPQMKYHVPSGQWVDLRTLQDIKDVHWGLIKQQRTAAEYGGFDWDGSIFDSNGPSQSRIQGAAQLAQIALLQGQSFSISWTLADNTVRILDANQMIAVGIALGTHINSCFEHGRTLRNEINAATAIEQVNLVTW